MATRNDIAGDGTEALLTTGLMLLCLAACAVIVWHFHDRFWWPPDDGAYGYIAERLLHGDVLNRDVQDIHPGYVHFLHALTFRVFGIDLLALRYPLSLLTVVQAGIVFQLMRRLGIYAAISGAAAIAALTFIQFLNPTANWYALFLTLSIIAVLTWDKPGPRRDVLCGFLLGLLFLFRQPTSVFIAAGTLVVLLTEDFGALGSTRRWAARLALAVTFAVLAAYLARYGNPVGLVLFGTWPLAIIAAAMPHAAVPPAAVIGLMARLFAGALLASLPLQAYHLFNGSFGIWLADIFGSSWNLVALEFFDHATYLSIIVLAIRGAIEPEAVLAAAFWLLLLTAPVLLGARVTWLMAARRAPSGQAPLMVLAVFYGLVSVHYEIPIYLFYSAGLTSVALIVAAPDGLFRRLACTAVLAACTIGMFQQAGQPLSRGLVGVAEGKRAAFWTPGLPKASLLIETADRRAYADLIAIIQAESGPQDAILVIPMNPELYFLADRRAPVRYYTTGFGLRDRRNVADAVALLASVDRPRIVMHRVADKYNTPLSDELMAAVERLYVYRGECYGLRIFTADHRLKPDSATRIEHCNPSREAVP
jgi:hypothetical protein